MAEAVGLALGVASLAGLFGATVDAFDQIKAAKSFSRDFEILSTRYDIRRATLLQWGAAVGLSGDGTRMRHPRLSQGYTRPLVERALNCIRMLLTDADELQTKYGLQQVRVSDEADSKALMGASLSRQRLEAFKESYSRFRTTIKDRQKGTSLLRKTQWAIVGVVEFRKLLQDLDDMIQDLYKLVPISLADQIGLIEEDAASLPNDIYHLELVKQALVEDRVSDNASNHSDDIEAESFSGSMSATPFAPGTAPPKSSFIESVMSRSRIIKPSTFASVASSNASWFTAVSYRASLIEESGSMISWTHSTRMPNARRPDPRTLNPRTGASVNDNPCSLAMTGAYRYDGLCSSAEGLLRGQRIEDNFSREMFADGNYKGLAVLCNMDSCKFYLKEHDSTKSAYWDTLNPTYGDGGLKYKMSFLAKSHTRQSGFFTGEDDARYYCLICRLTGGHTTPLRLFTGVDDLMTHVNTHVGERLGSFTFEGGFIFTNASAVRTTNDDFDVSFFDPNAAKG